MIVVSLTTHPARVENIPSVVASLHRQTVKPDVILLNLAEDQFADVPACIPEGVTVNWVPKDTKVWKKFLPAFDLYPDAYVINIDDDYSYPPGMIEDFITSYHGNPVSGNRVTNYGMACHCGCASLTRREHFGKYIKQLNDQKLQKACPSSDMAYTFFAKMNGFDYDRTKEDYAGRKLSPLNQADPYSINPSQNVVNTYKYLSEKYGIPESKPVIYYTIAWDNTKNIGRYYNAFTDIVPDDAWIAFVDGDTIFTTSDYGRIIEDTIAAHPEAEAFTCVTNRVGCQWQIALDADIYSDDMREHRAIGERIARQYRTDVRDVTDQSLFSGLFLLIKKSLWKKIGGAAPYGMLGVDNDIHKHIRAVGSRLYLMKGLYLYHWYRGGNKNDTHHLL